VQSFSGNEEFFFQGGKQGIVLVHGYTGAPGEMRLLGEYLHQQGLTVLGVRLAWYYAAGSERDQMAGLV
jgi:carboxylesterase